MEDIAASWHYWCRLSLVAGLCRVCTSSGMVTAAPRPSRRTSPWLHLRSSWRGLVAPPSLSSTRWVGHYMGDTPLGTLHGWHTPRDTTWVTHPKGHYMGDTPQGTPHGWHTPRDTTWVTHPKGHYMGDTSKGTLHGWHTPRDTTWVTHPKGHYMGINNRVAVVLLTVGINSEAAWINNWEGGQELTMWWQELTVKWHGLTIGGTRINNVVAGINSEMTWINNWGDKN